MNQLNKQGEKEGYWKEYWPYSNNLLCKGNYISGVRNGLWQGYYENKNPSYKGNYINGRKEGYWECYKSSGAFQNKIYHIL